MPLHRFHAWILIATACAEGAVEVASATADGDLDCAERIVSLRIEPAVSEVEAGPMRRATVRYRAIAATAEGRNAVVPAQWWLSRSDVGSIDGSGLFSTPGLGGGMVRVRASAGELEAEATLAVTWVDGNAASGDAEALAKRFAQARPSEGPDPLLRITAPADATWVGTFDPIEIAWEGPAYDAYRLTLSSRALAVTLYTRARHFNLSEAQRAAIAQTHPGELVQVAVEGERSGEIRRSASGSQIGFCATSELCNGRDDDCNGQEDDGCLPTELWAQSPSRACPETEP